MIEYAQLKPGPGFQLDRAALYYTQRLAIWPPVRRVAAALIAAGLRWGRDGHFGTPDSNIAQLVSELERYGVSRLPPLASGDYVEEIKAYFQTQPVLGPEGVPMALSALPASAGTAAYDLTTVLKCPRLLDLVNAPQVLRIAGAYLGCKPTLSSIGVRWSFPGSDKILTDTQRFHRDVDDWRFLKLFIYLTDVDEGAGPHVYVRQTHRGAFGLRAQAYTMDQIKARFGADNVMMITGPAGTTFMADTLGVHCGVAPIVRPRLILQVQYSLLPIYAFSYRPIQHASNVDPYCNRLLVRSPSATS